MPDDADPRTARLERALDSSHDGFWERNLRTNVSWYSPSFRSLFGFAPDELPDDRNAVNARVHPDDIAGFLAAYDEAIRTLRPFTYEVRFLDRHERWRWVRGRGRVWAGVDGAAEIIAGALSDVHDEKETRLELERMSERFEHATAAAKVGLFEREIDSDAIYVSARLWHLLGYEPGEFPALRSAFLGLIHPDDALSYAEQAGAAHASLSRLTTLTRLRCKSGEYRWFRQDAQPHRLPDGRLRVTGVLADVHEQILARQALEQHREQLERQVHERTASLEAALVQAEQRGAEAAEADAAKSRFLAHMSHEIRTPLNGLLGLTELALRVAREPAQKRYLEVALQSGQTLRQIIDQVLELARMEAGASVPADEVFDLADALAETFRGVIPLTRDKAIAMRFDWIGAHTRVRGDAARLRQIVINLLGNAVKFTERGHVEMSSALEEAGGNTGRATIRVRDSGPGMQPQQLAGVFEAFVQGDASLSRRHGGTGLGLTIARGLARQLGGDIEVDSEPGVGSTFTLHLPFALVPQEAEADPPVRGPVWHISSRSEDAAWLARRFARLGCTLHTIPDVATAIQAACALPPQERPSLLLVPERSLTPPPDLGALRRALPNAHIALMVRPDWNDLALESLALALDFGLMIGPLAPRDLRLLLRAGPPAQPALLSAAPPRPEPQAAHVLLVEDNPVNRLIAEEFLHALGVAVRTAGNGEQALAACQAATPQLVLMDLQMPVMDGLEATRRLRALQHQGTLAPFPIVALSAHALDGDREQAAAAGVDAYLTKPILLDVLRAELGRWLPELTLR